MEGVVVGMFVVAVTGGVSEAVWLGGEVSGAPFTESVLLADEAGGVRWLSASALLTSALYLIRRLTPTAP